VVSDRLETEGRILGRYIARNSIPPALVIRYADHVRRMPSPKADRLDQLLLRAAHAGGPLTQMADAYARMFRPGGCLRQRLAIICALVESSPPYHIAVGAARVGSTLGSVVHLSLTASVGTVVLAGAFAVFAPIHLLMLPLYWAKRP